MKRIILNVGDIVVSSEPSILETVLGSCVSVCLWDVQLRIGGMNHFMLPQMIDGIKNPAYCGMESTDRLINTILEMGASINNIKAKIFGGGRVIKVYQRFDVGSENVMAAKKLLMKYGIPIISELTGDKHGTKIVFYSATGKVFVKRIKGHEESILRSPSEENLIRGEMRW